MDTLKLNPNTWDLTLDTNGNIEVATDKSAIAQDVASALATFKSEVFYNTTLGVPYFGQILGENYNPILMGALFEKAALTVPGVVSAKATLNFDNRKLSGIVQVIDTTGASLGVSF